MQMTEEEIVKKYRESDKKSSYIQILADLNACKPQDIRKILKDYGVPLPGNPNFSKPNANPSHVKKVESTKNKEEVSKPDTSIDTLPIEPVKKEVIMNTKINLPDSVKIVIENEINKLKKEKEEIDQKIRELQDFIKKNS